MQFLYEILKNFKGNKKNAIIFDIDETLISLKGEKILWTIDFFNYIKNNGITPMLITARPSIKSSIKYTKQQLKKLGISGYKYIYFMEQGTNVWKYKKESRKNIEDKGYNIIMSIGDKPWDIGKYGGIGVLINHEQNKFEICNFCKRDLKTLL